MPAEEDHRHCKVCGRVCAADEETCSRACRERRERLLETRRNYSYLLYGLIAFLVLLLALNFVHL